MQARHLLRSDIAGDIVKWKAAPSLCFSTIVARVIAAEDSELRQAASA